MEKSTFKYYLLGIVVAVITASITAGIVISSLSGKINSVNSVARVGAAVTPPANLMQATDPVVPISNLVTLNTSVQNAFDVAGTTTFTGAANFTDVARVQDTPSSTIYIGAGAGGGITQSGCEVMGHSLYGNPVYITVTSSTVSATTTRPAICQL